MNREQYNSDTRYEKVLHNMDLLGIMDITTTRQHKNGTIVWKLPIKNNNSGKTNIEVASFSTGYVRNQNSGYSNYQLNKRCASEPEYFELDNGDYRKFTTRSCKLIPIEIDRLEYLISYCLKNYYIKNANQVANGEFVSKWEHEYKLKQVTTHTMNCKNSSQLDLESEVRSLESKYQASQADIRDLENKLSNAISPTKHQCVINKLHDLENKLATIERIARINASYR